jgi:hypothetical protein
MSEKHFFTRTPVIVASSVLLFLSFCYGQRRSDPSQQTRPREVSGSGQTVQVGPRENLQKAIDTAKPGDTIVLPPNASYQGPLTLPNKGGTSDSYITIRTSNLAGIPPENTRTKPDLHAANMPKILAPNSGSALVTAPGAHHYRFIGVEFAPAPDANYVYNVIHLGSDEYTDASQLPHHLIFDRCYVHSTGLGKARRGFALNCGDTSILNSYIAGFAGPGDETQGIAGWNGSGPFKIVNNHIEGGGQNVFFGGGDPRIPNLVPSDVEIRRNYLTKPSDWKGKVTIKAIFEMKNVRHLIIDGNLLVDNHTTTAFALTVRNQSGTAPWSTVQDVEITNNVIQHANGAVNILGLDDLRPSQQGKRMRVANNLFVDTGEDNTAFVQTSRAESITIEHNTVQHTGNVITSHGGPTTKFIFRNNILQNNAYGVFCEGGVLDTCLPGASFSGNVIVDNYDSAGKGYPLDRNYPPGNFFPRSLKEVGFVNLEQNDFRLGPTSHFRKRATDGKDIGVNFDELKASGAMGAGDLQ